MDQIQTLMEFPAAFDRNTHYIGIAYMTLLGAWLLAGAGGALWAAFDAPKIGASRAVWVPAIFLTGPFGLAAYLGRVRCWWPAAAAVWLALFLLPAVWVGVLFRERRALYGFMQQNFTPPVPLQRPAAQSKAEEDARLVKEAQEALKEAEQELDDANRTAKKYKKLTGGK